MENYAWLIPALPLTASLWIAADYLVHGNRGEAGEKQTAWVAQGAAGLSLLLALLLALPALWQGAPGQVQVAEWLRSGDLVLNISFTLDPLGLAMTTLVAFISLLTLRFSINYLHREAGFQRFFLVLCLFMAAMELIVMAGSAFLTFVGWELAGVGSYLLIAYAFERPNASRNATRAFVTNRIGDAGFLLALFLSWHWLGGVEWTTIESGAAQLSTVNADLLALGFLLAALAKSAQVPFAPWIARALEGPTPSSAVFYGSLMVHAGVFLLLRLEPLLLQAPQVASLLLVLGLLTALYGWLSGLTQTDVKSALMFSTTAQVGLMFVWCGLGWFELAAWHLALNALWRAYQFLHAPALMHLISRPARPVPPWLAGRQRLRTAALHRFWLDSVADWLLVRPTRALARDADRFDETVVSRMVGLPEQEHALSSLSDWEARKQQGTGSEVIGQGRGILGRSMEWLANLLHWFEDRLVLHGGGEGLMRTLRHLGGYALRIERLLESPRYLLLLIMATFVVIL
ncbi:MAG: proton-conducting transporter membrane subunit [Pseudomonadota bacterium]|nr:proton-conducting transporter membrane subunit [Pseudomonadota bacterium]